MKSTYGELKLEHGRQTTIEVIFDDVSWRFAGRHPPARWDEKFIIGHVHIPDTEPLTVCSEWLLAKEQRGVRLWVVDPANQPLVAIWGGGNAVPRYNRECSNYVYASAKSAAGNEMWMVRPGIREAFRDFFLPGSPYASTKSDSIFSDRPLIAGVLIYEKLVRPLADSSSFS
ncbi:MAG TPA: hypothetical protein VK961_02640 [Chthoniobacter sp.]|nr:hypothetical protein [Chthoniobacter sp.]